MTPFATFFHDNFDAIFIILYIVCIIIATVYTWLIYWRYEESYTLKDIIFGVSESNAEIEIVVVFKFIPLLNLFLPFYIPFKYIVLFLANLLNRIEFKGKKRNEETKAELKNIKDDDYMVV